MLWKLGYLLGYLLYLLFSVLPIPALTNIFMFSLNVKRHIARRKPRFKKEMEIIEKKIKEYEALGKPCFLNYYNSQNFPPN